MDITSLDVSVFHFLNDLYIAYPPLALGAVFFAHYFPYLVVVSALAYAFIARKSIREKSRLILSGSLSILLLFSLVIPVIRLFIERPRPFLTQPSIQLLTESSYSFPSGHASAFFAIAIAMYFFNKRIGYLFLFAALLISIGRIMVGVHYPTDVLAGAIIGSTVSIVTSKLFKFLLP